MLGNRQTNKKRGVAALGVLALVATALPLTSMVANAGYVDRERVFDNKVTAGADLDLVVAQNGGATINDAAVPAGYEIAWDGATAGQNSDTNTKGTVRLNAPNIAPGDTVEIPLTPENVGNLPMTYTLDACVVVDVQAATSLDGIDDGDASDFAGVGADTTSTTGVVVSILDSDGNVLGTTDAGGACTFDTARALAVGANEELTLQLAFPTTMTNAATGAVVDVDLTFNGAQSSAGGLDVSGITTSSPSDKVAMGLRHTCEIRNGGEVWCWGSDGSGQLGNGNAGSSTTASRAGTISDAVSVSAGQHNSFAITSTGDLYAWGDNSYGELGVGNTSSQQSPVLVSGISGVKKVAADTGYDHTIILLDDSTVRVAGDTNYTGSRSGSPSTFGAPTDISGGVVFSGVKDIANGSQSTFLINGDGTVWGVGNRRLNALNNHNSNSSTYHTEWQRIGTRTDAEQLWGRHLGGVYKTTGDEYYGWGRDDLGQLGLSNTINSTSGGRYHTILPHYADAEQLAYGASHVIMLKNDGTVWSNGYNGDGRLGDGSTTNRLSPVQVSGISGDVTGVMAGYNNSSAITTTGRYAWGGNNHGQLGVANTSSNQSTPQPVIQ